MDDDAALEITPSQTIGPYFHYGLTPNGRYPWNDFATCNLIAPDVSGERIRVEGRVYDGDGQPVPDCLLEIWQADAQGRFPAPPDDRPQWGFGRCSTDMDGNYFFETIKPGVVPTFDGKPQAPHLLLAVFARGLLLHLYSRIYFGNEAANRTDPVLALVPVDRRATLIAAPKLQANATIYSFDIHLQGERETAFFDI